MKNVLFIALVVFVTGCASVPSKFGQGVQDSLKNYGDCVIHLGTRYAKTTASLDEITGVAEYACKDMFSRFESDVVDDFQRRNQFTLLAAMKGRSFAERRHQEVISTMRTIVLETRSR